jgi:hypothetical protein
MPIIRSLLIGMLLVGGLLALFLAATPSVYQHYLVRQPGLHPAHSRAVMTTISRLGWAWVILGIVGAHVWHTRHLDRTTRSGVVAEALMLLQYVLWLVLGMALQLVLPLLNR